MITKNGVKMMMNVLSKGLTEPTLINMVGEEVPFTNITGRTSGYSDTRTELLNGMNNLANSSYGIAVGTGTIAPQKADYKLENDVSTSFARQGSPATIVSYGDDYSECYATVPIKNTSSEAITLTEIGLYFDVYCTVGGTYTVNHILFDRTLLSSPITIGAGETKSITYTIKFNYPTE